MVRPVDKIVKVLGIALVAAVLLLVFAMWRQGNSLDAFTEQQRGDAGRADCRSRVAAEVDRIEAAKRIRNDDSIAAGFDLVILSSEIRERPLSGPDDPRLAEAKRLTLSVKTNAAAVQKYNPRLTQLAVLRTQSPQRCAENPAYSLPPDLLVLEP